MILQLTTEEAEGEEVEEDTSSMEAISPEDEVPRK